MAADDNAVQAASQASAVSSDPNEELKMDKDLGLFEMINAGDFATVTNQSAAAASTGAAAQGETFNFSEANASSGAA